MHEDVVMSTGTRLNFLRNEPDVLTLELSDCRIQVWHAQRDVVQSFAALGDEPGNYRVIRRWLQQFQPGLADRDHHHSHLFRLDQFLGRYTHAQFLVRRLRRGKRLHCYTEMVKSKSHNIWLPTPNVESLV